MNLPNRPLTNLDLVKYAKLLKIPYFRGVYMRDSLPPDGPNQREAAILNLDDQMGAGTHWVAYRKSGRDVIYFDSFGNLRPPRELMNYLRVDKVKYNREKFQDYNNYNCGHLCLQFLSGKLI